MRNHSRRSMMAWLLPGVLGTVLLATRAQARIDLMGTWSLTAEGEAVDGLVPIGQCTFEVTQTGDRLEAHGPCDVPGWVDLMGTVDKDKRRFSLDGSGNAACKPLHIEGTVSAVGEHATGDYTCDGVPGKFHGTQVSGRCFGSATDPIVNGTLTSAYPSTGALLQRDNPTTARSVCTGVLIGCETFLTAAHCFCGEDVPGNLCQGTNLTNPDNYLVFFQHAGFFPVKSITVRPDFIFGRPIDDPTNDASTGDLAVIKLWDHVTGIAPSPITTTDPAACSSAKIAGFGLTSQAGDDSGLKRFGTARTTACWDNLVCWKFTGSKSNTCSGDSGGPLFLDFGAGPVVAGITSGGDVPCDDTGASFDANVYFYRDWIAQASADLGNMACDSLPPAGGAGTRIEPFTGTLDETAPVGKHHFEVFPGTSELRVTLNAHDNAECNDPAPGDMVAAGVCSNDTALACDVDADCTNFNLFVNYGSEPTTSKYDSDYNCARTGPGQYGYCSFPNPDSAKPWYVRVEGGSGEYQVTATIFGGDAPVAPVCGNNVREASEACDGTDIGSCAGGCSTECACVSCVPGDLTIYAAKLSRKFLFKGTLWNKPGLDPRSGDFTLTVTDGAGDPLQLTIPAGDAGWAWNPRKRRLRWRGSMNGVRAVILQGGVIANGGGEVWSVTMKGKDVTGAAAIGFSGRRYTVTAGGTCGASAG